jgi:hypothetical protein
VRPQPSLKFAYTPLEKVTVHEVFIARVVDASVYVEPVDTDAKNAKSSGLVAADQRLV